MSFKLYDYQLDAIKRMHNGCILCGGVGSGKSRTALGYYFLRNGGPIDTDEYIPMSDPPKDLYIITTAKKRDSKEWGGDMAPFLLSENKEVSLYSNSIMVDSWNNLGKYSEVKDAFFIFDEQRLVGKGAWVKSFLKIAKGNEWVLLSATPGDTWSDYIPVFIANGFYKNRTEFEREHVIFSRFSKFPQVSKYIGTAKLNRLRKSLMVEMNFGRNTVAHHEDVYISYNSDDYKEAFKNRWNKYKNAPIENAGGLCYILRRIVNSDNSRQEVVLELFKKHKRVIIFYNFNYELDILRGLTYGENVEIAEWNGHKHQLIPSADSWVYLVQYTSGCEGWSCIETDAIIFYSQNYSYKTMVQAAGRIDRLNTPFTDLYFYHLKSRSGIDLAISKALKNKKNFNHAMINW